MSAVGSGICPGCILDGGLRVAISYQRNDLIYCVPAAGESTAKGKIRPIPVLQELHIYEIINDRELALGRLSTLVALKSHHAAKADCFRFAPSDGLAF